jgi:transposase-like protein
MAQTIIKDGKVKLLPYSVVELCTIYNVCDRTFKKWVKPFEQEIGIKQGRYYNISQVRIIMEKLGLPAEIELDA